MQGTIRLRPLRGTDVRAYYQIVKEPSVASGANFPVANDLKQARRLLKTDLRSGRSLAITLKRQLIGVISLYATIGKGGAPDDRHLELGYFMRPESQGRGYMTRAVRLIINRVRKSARVTKLVADVGEDNPASIRVLERNGFASYRSVLDLARDYEDLIFERSV